MPVSVGLPLAIGQIHRKLEAFSPRSRRSAIHEEEPAQPLPHGKDIGRPTTTPRQPADAGHALPVLNCTLDRRSRNPHTFRANRKYPLHPANCFICEIDCLLFRNVYHNSIAIVTLLCVVFIVDRITDDGFL